MQEVYDCVVHNINVLYTSCFQIINKAAPKTEEHLTEDEKLQRSVSDDWGAVQYMYTCILQMYM